MVQNNNNQSVKCVFALSNSLPNKHTSSGACTVGIEVRFPYGGVTIFSVSLCKWGNYSNHRLNGTRTRSHSNVARTAQQHIFLMCNSLITSLEIHNCISSNNNNNINDIHISST